MKSSYIFGIFAVICFIMAGVYSSDVSKMEIKSMSGEGGIYGPLLVNKKNDSYEIVIKNNVALNKWSFIEVNVLDKDKKHMFGFGDGMWHESGYDEGYWEESKTDFSMDVTFKDPGQYYFEVKAERNDGKGNPIIIHIVKEKGSNVPFITLAIISIIAAIFAHYFGSKIDKNDKKSKTTRYLVIAGVLIIAFIMAMTYSARGYGYMGYNGYHHGPSFFYMGGPNIYHNRSNRDGSISGSGQRGGGFNGGK